MNKEEVTQVKISMPLIDNIELQRIDTFYNDIVSEYTKAFVKEKEQVIIQRLMKNLQQENQQLKSVIKEIREYINSYDVFKEFSFPLMKRDEENQIKSSIKYEFDTSIKKALLQILDKYQEGKHE